MKDAEKIEMLQNAISEMHWGNHKEAGISLKTVILAQNEEIKALRTLCERLESRIDALTRTSSKASRQASDEICDLSGYPDYEQDAFGYTGR